ncbi:MAG: GGDEF domain-containing response regulator [Gammaproteobacteria bacterium]
MNTALHTNDVALEKPGVLVVDDSQVMRRAIQRILGQDFAVIEAEDGKVAWDILAREHAIQVVFSDLMMPNKNGFELLRDIRESVYARINRLPVIIMTGHEDDEKIRRQVMSLGASDFISKPFDSVQLKARANVHAKADHTSRQLEQAHELLAKKTTIDPLTGLANLRYLHEHGASLLAFAVRQNAELALLCVELDKFDVVFRKKGRHIAEKILAHVGRIIGASVRREDLTARIGLAKFAVIMPGADHASASKAANRIHTLIGESLYRLGDERFRVTASAGLVTGACSPDLQIADIIKRAEQPLGRAIDAGGNRLMVDQPVCSDPASAGVDNRAPPASLSLDGAIGLLAAGQSEALDNELAALISRLLPLLAYGNQQLGLGLDESLAQLGDRLVAAQAMRRETSRADSVS